MRLFLSSQSLGKHPKVFLEMVGGHRLALVENAKDDWSEQDRKNGAKENAEEFMGEGFKVEEIDLRDYFGKQDKLLNKLSNFGGIFIFGGNSFILRRAMAASGLDKILKDFLAQDKIAYGGSSAGSIVATPSLKGAENDTDDNPNTIPSGYDKKIIWKGLDLIPFHIVPHYRSDWYGKEANKMAGYFKKHNLPYRALRDGQVIAINGDKEEFLP